MIASKAAALPGNTSVTVSVGVHVPPGIGVGVGVGGTGVGVGGTGVGVGVGGTGVGVGAGGPPAHCARISNAFALDDALRVKSTGCPGFGIVNVAVTGAVVPDVKPGMLTFAFVELTTV